MNEPLLYEPGTNHKYSNYGYIVLGAILEKIEQKPFKQIIENNILNIIGAQSTHYQLTEEVKGKAKSYRFNSDGSKVDKTPILENVTPDGGMYSTTEDIAAFYHSLLYTNQLLNDEHKVLITTDYKGSSKTWSDILSNYNSHWNSYGGAPGVSAAVEVLLKDKFIVVILANTDGLVAEKMSQEIINVYNSMAQ